MNEGKQKIIIFVLVGVLGILLIAAITQQILLTVRHSYFLKTPFDTITVLDTRIRLKQEEKIYEETIDCTSLTKEKSAFYYRLKEHYRTAKVNTTEYIFSGNTLLKEEYTNPTDILVIATVDLEKAGEEYQEVYTIHAICKPVETKKEETTEPVVETPVQEETPKKSTKKK